MAEGHKRSPLPKAMGFWPTTKGHVCPRPRGVSWGHAVIARRVWLEEFPSFKGRDLFVSGESYAGDYGPQLVLEIIEGSDTGLRNQLKGLLLGNPVLSCPAWKEFHESLQLEMYFWHGLVPITTIMEWKSMGCDKNLTSSCLKMYGEARAAIGAYLDRLQFALCSGSVAYGRGWPQWKCSGRGVSWMSSPCDTLIMNFHQVLLIRTICIPMSAPGTGRWTSSREIPTAAAIRSRTGLQST